jgi:hypothetical protein
MLDDVPYTEVLDGRDAANAGEEAEGKPLSTVCRFMEQNSNQNPMESHDERNRAAFVDRGLSGVTIGNSDDSSL